MASRIGRKTDVIIKVRGKSEVEAPWPEAREAARDRSNVKIPEPPWQTLEKTLARDSEQPERRIECLNNGSREGVEITVP